MAQFTYRLQTLLEQKERARAEAEKALAKAERERDDEIQKLREMELKQKQLVEKRDQVRREMLAARAGSGTLMARDAQGRSDFVRFMGTEIERARAEVIAQGSVVEQHHARVTEASVKSQTAKRELDLLSKHRARLEERYRRVLETKEELLLDEIGNALYSTRRRST
jgi:flagellar biosynthesis chaperone FliJ